MDGEAPGVCLVSTPARGRRALGVGGWADRLWAALAWSAFGVGLAFFVALTGSAVARGMGAIDLSFLVDAPSDAGRAGGIAPVLLSTVWVLAIAFVVTLPIGIGAAVFLAEIARRTSRSARWVRRALDVLAGVPSVVYGLFGNALFGVWLGFGYSILAGGLTLACMVLPFFTRQAEEAILAVPIETHRAGVALGFSRWGLVRRVLLPIAAPGILVGLTLSVGRAVAETAALLYTSGRSARWPESWLDSGRTISVHIYELAVDVPGGEERAYASALLLLGLLFVGTSLAAWCSRAWIRRLSGGGSR